MKTELSNTRPARLLRPDVDVYEGDNGLLLRADLPGVTADGLDVRIEQGLLTMSGTRTLPRTGERIEYRRRFHVPRHIDGSKVSAHLDRGVLSVTLPKSDAARPRKIPVTVG